MSIEQTPDSDSGKPPVALIAGPTASGKTDLAVELALALEKSGKHAVVLNADSAQVYSDLQILSARPDEAEMSGIEHRLFGEWDGATACSAADWARRAKKEIAALHGEGAVPIIVGGTGLYMRTLLNGIAPIPEIDPNIRSQVRSLSVEDAYSELQTEDPDRSSSLNPNDTTRIARALEVVRSTGKTMAYWQTKLSGGISSDIRLQPLILLPDREELYAQCDLRFGLMVENGAVEEVEALLARGLDPALPVMRAIGVPEISAWIEGELSREEAIASGQQATRNYAKRQYTWFRRQPPINWKTAPSKNVDIKHKFEGLFQF